MIWGYARVSTDGESVDAQVTQLRAAGAKKIYQETASGARRPCTIAPRPRPTRQGRRAYGHPPRPAGALDPRSLQQTAAIADKGAGFRSLGNTWAATATAHGRLMLTFLVACFIQFERVRAGFHVILAIARMTPTGFQIG